MTAIEMNDYYERGHPVLDISPELVTFTVDTMEPYAQAGVASSQEFCLIANVVRAVTGADYVEIDYHRRPNDIMRGVAVTRHGDEPLRKWSLPEKIAWIAADFDHDFEECDATREEALEWLTNRK